MKQNTLPHVNIKNEQERIRKAEERAEAAAANANRILNNHLKKQTVGTILWYCRKLDIHAEAFANALGLKKFLYGNDVDRLQKMESALKEMYIQKKKAEKEK